MLNKSKIIRTAEKYVIAGKIAQAVGEYRKLIEQDPEEPLLLNTVGDLLVRQGRQQEALGYYRQVAELYFNGGFYVKAGAMLKKILQLDKSDLQSRERLAELYEKQGLRFESAYQLRQLIEAHESAGDFSRALIFSKRLTEVLSNDPEAWRDRARLSIRAEHVEPALEFFIQAVTGFQRNKEFGQAWETVIEAFPLDSSNRVLLDQLVEVADARDQLIEAKGLLETEIQSTGEDFPYRFYLGLILEKLEQPDQAAEQYTLLRERGFDDQRVTEAMIRVGHLEPLAGEPPQAEDEPLELDFAVMPPDSGVQDLELLKAEEKATDAFSLADQESSPEMPEEFSRSEPGSGLFDLAEMTEEDEPGGTFRLGESEAGVLESEIPELPVEEPPPAEELELGPEAEADELELPHEAVASLDEALEEVDFYLKLGFSEDATGLLKRLIHQFPGDERVISRARKARVPVPASEQPAEPEVVEEAPKAGVSAPADFENEIENALDGLFVGTQEERAPVEPVLRYDIAAKVDSSTGDFRVHYDLGLAYKEMGLLEDAVQEFRQAFEMIEDSEQHPQQILCCSMLASCHLQLSRLQEAIEWARRGLEIPDLKEFEIKALQYDLALALERDGETSEAVEVYRKIADHDQNYRDVRKRLEELES